MKSIRSIISIFAIFSLLFLLTSCSIINKLVDEDDEKESSVEFTNFINNYNKENVNCVIEIELEVSIETKGDPLRIEYNTLIEKCGNKSHIVMTLPNESTYDEYATYEYYIVYANNTYTLYEQYQNTWVYSTQSEESINNLYRYNIIDLNDLSINNFSYLDETYTYNNAPITSDINGTITLEIDDNGLEGEINISYSSLFENEDALYNYEIEYYDLNNVTIKIPENAIDLNNYYS